MWYQLRPLAEDLNDGVWFEPGTGEFVEIENTGPEIFNAILIKRGHGEVNPKRLREMLELYPHRNFEFENFEELIRSANERGFENMSSMDQQKLLDVAHFIFELGGIGDQPRSTIAILDSRYPEWVKRRASIELKKEWGFTPVVLPAIRQTVVDLLRKMGIKKLT